MRSLAVLAALFAGCAINPRLERRADGTCIATADMTFGEVAIRCDDSQPPQVQEPAHGPLPELRQDPNDPNTLILVPAPVPQVQALPTTAQTGLLEHGSGIFGGQLSANSGSVLMAIISGVVGYFTGGGG